VSKVLVTVALVWILFCPFSRAGEAITSIELSITASDIDALAQNPRNDVPIVVQFAGKRVTNTTVHLKGTGSFRPISEKPSFSIRSTEPNLFGRKKLLLNNSSQDPSFLKWKIASELFTKAGVPASEVSFARVTLNGAKLGLYLMVEPADKKFLKKHFKDATGNLYEGDNKDITDVLDKDGGDANQEQQDVRRLANACLEEDLRKRWKRLNEVLKVDEFLSFMAVEVLVDHRDGYCMDRNNFRLYHNPADDKFVFLPHGLDLLFYSTDLRPSRSFSSVMAQAILETPEGTAAYKNRFTKLAREFYADDQILKRIDEIWRSIQRDAPADAQHAVAALRKVVKARMEAL
jgi:spore coat protein H